MLLHSSWPSNVTASVGAFSGSFHLHLWPKNIRRPDLPLAIAMGYNYLTHVLAL